MGCASDKLGRHVNTTASEWPVILPLRMKLPNFRHRFFGRDGVRVADEFSHIRKMRDRRLVVIGTPGSPFHLRLAIQAKRQTSRRLLRRGGEGDLWELLTSVNFVIRDTTKAELDEEENLADLFGWPIGEECREVQVFSLGGDRVCEVPCNKLTCVFEVKDHVARVTGKPMEALRLCALEDKSLQLIISATDSKIFLPSEVEHLIDSSTMSTRLSKIGENWDVYPSSSTWGGTRKIELGDISSSSKLFTIIQRSGNIAGGGGYGQTIDRQTRTALVKTASDDTFVVFANAKALGPDAMDTTFEGELRLHGMMLGRDMCAKLLLLALGLVLAGADEEKWMKEEDLKWGEGHGA